MPQGTKRLRDSSVAAGWGGAVIVMGLVEMLLSYEATFTSRHWFIIDLATASLAALLVALHQRSGSDKHFPRTWPWVMSGLAMSLLVPAMLPHEIRSDAALRSAASSCFAISLVLPAAVGGTTLFAMVAERMAKHGRG
ncbi:MAG: hypothetical protein E6R08_00435 [Nevskiaceae bacterium]|nr:MAG: hypothetical protein E6R08_00435 [Nevskiaceae bacterium]